MIQLKILHTWIGKSFSTFLTQFPGLDYIFEKINLLKIAKEIYADDFVTYCFNNKIDTEKLYTDTDKLFIEFARIHLDGNEKVHLNNLMTTVIQKYLPDEYSKSVTFLIDYTYKSNAYIWTVSLLQVVPTTKEDIFDLVEQYMKADKSDPALTEIVVESLLKE